MGKLTLEEAIKYVKEVAQKNKRNKEKNTIIIPNSFISSDDCAEKYGQVAKWLEELKSYKIAEEQGLLMRLPVDKKVYIISYRWTECSEYGTEFNEYNCEGCEYECDSKKEYYIYSSYFVNLSVDFYIKRLGETLFFTHEEAEKKLEELRNNG